MQEFLNNQQEKPFYIKIKAIPNAQKTEISEKLDHETWKMRVNAVPEKNKANKEIIKFFKKKFGAEVEIISGKTDRIKLIKII